MNKRLSYLLIASALTLCGCDKTVTQTQYDYMYDHMCEMWAKTLSANDYDIAFFGDSRVAGGKFEEHYKDLNVVNLGVGGDRVSHCIRRFNLIEASKPETVFLNIGGNDALSSEFNLETYDSEYRVLLNKFKERNIRVILHTIAGCNIQGIPDRKVLDDRKANMKVANEKIKDLANEYNYELIDIAPLLNDENQELKAEYTFDGCHFNESGNAIWYAEIDKVLNGAK